MPKMALVRARWLSRMGCFFAFWALQSAPAAADLAELRVERAPGAESCPDEASLLRAVQALGSDAAAKREPLRASVRFAREAQAFTAAIELFGSGKGRRTLSAGGDDCRELADAVAVALALALDGSQARATEPEAPKVEQARAEPASPKPPQSQPAPQPIPALEPPKRSSRPLHVTVGPEIGVGYNLLGGVPSLALRGLLSLESGHYQLGFSGIWLQPRELAYGPGRVEIGIWAGALHFCAGGAPTANPAWALCPALLAGQFLAKASGYDANGSKQQAWFALAASGTLRFPITRRVGIELRLSGIVPFERDRLVVRNVGRAFETPAVGGMLEIGPLLTLL